MTITQVAQRAGVSMKTVSRVLNAEPHVREEVRQRVLDAAKALRYRPKVSARSLAGSRSYVIAYLIGDPSISYIGQAQLGALQACRKHGYHLLIEAIDLGAPELAAELEALFATLSVDGVILTPPYCDHPVVLDALDAAGVPYARVAPARDPDRGPHVEADDRRAAGEMTRHLLGLGHRRIGFVAGPPGHGASEERLAGYRQALAEAGVDPEEALIRQGRFDFASGCEAAEALLALAEAPTAVFASNDQMALGVMAAAQRQGLKIPEDLSVAGCDDAPFAAMLWPPLTTVRQPVSAMAALATEMIIAAAARHGPAPEPEPSLPRSELVIRGSTAPPLS